MKATKTTSSATIAMLFVGGLMISPASAAIPQDSAENFYRWTDISFVTQGATAKAGNELKSGRIDGFYKRSDRNHGQIPSGLKPLGKSATNFYKWSDITSVTHN